MDGDVVAHAARLGVGEDVEQVGMVVGRHSVGGDHAGHHDPAAPADADMRADHEGERHGGEAHEEVGELEVVHRQQEPARDGDVRTIAAAAVARRQEQDQRQDGERAPAVAVVGHGEGIGIRRIAEISRHQGDQAAEDDEQRGGQQRQASPCHEAAGDQHRRCRDDRADDGCARRRPIKIEAGIRQPEVEPADSIVEIDVWHVAVMELPGAGKVEQQVPGHRPGEHMGGRQQRPGRRQQRHAG
jgi:hypothetical protein